MTTPLHSRAEVGLRPPRSVSRNVTPVHLTGHYGGPSPWGSVDRSSPTAFRDSTNHARCPSIWRAWQAWHMDHNGWADIAYSSGACPHGHRYEGRGKGFRTAAQGTNDGNQRSLATVYIAGGNDPLTDEAKAAFLDEEARFGLPLDKDHGDWHSTACGGPFVRPWIKAGRPRPASATPTPQPSPQPVPPPPRDDFKEKIMAKPVLTEGAGAGEREHQLHDVGIMQSLMQWHGAVPVNSVNRPEGRFDHTTYESLRAWQARTGGLVPDGVCGPATWAWLCNV